MATLVKRVRVLERSFWQLGVVKNLVPSLMILIDFNIPPVNQIDTRFGLSGFQLNVAHRP
jgi:hypothetical protein